VLTIGFGPRKMIEHMKLLFKVLSRLCGLWDDQRYSANNVDTQGAERGQLSWIVGQQRNGLSAYYVPNSGGSGGEVSRVL
jgi:hypothetical protein